ncbi:carbohydrate esterase family 16 protein [Teratosphaeria destructans]|uniref:Carbohydrate esterase family 16 protein n=1 Tax=Teratosphaeria destructans TaxID=418781 RepID=A0A9W7SJN4_9PEZI|nr:carbohydrate esterase family 16 protein [Teratosphaeria destructans]
MDFAGYSQTGFTPEGQAPSDALPLGNPDPPSQWTAVNGPSWLEFLATHHNVSAFKAINFARGGAMVDGDIVKPLSPEIITVKQQVREVYMPNYGYDAAVDRNFNWKPDSSLFAFWIGINDVVGASTEGYPGGGGGHLMRDMATYATLVDEVYQSGARNFLFFTVPCIERSPLFLSGLFGKAKERNLAKNTFAFNDQIVAMANNLTTTYPDAWAHVFDSHLLFRKIIEDPCLYPETCAYKNTTTFCKPYEGGTFGDWYAKYDDCPLPVDQYFWLDFLHPTFRVMNATARVLSKELGEQRVILHG